MKSQLACIPWRTVRSASYRTVCAAVLFSLLPVIMCSHAHAEQGTFVDTVRFIQYLDENTALEEVRNGNLDIYYYKISADRLENANSRIGLDVHDSAGGSYSILINPAESDEFNPFSIKQVRFALNYLVDRKIIVNELMGGFGSEIISYYGPHDPEYLSIIEQLETFNFKYNPILAESLISEALLENGAYRADEKWMFDGEPVGITIFIRSDDPVRKAIGEILSSRLQDMGFAVHNDFGDLNKAFVVVYGSNPAELRWSLYTEGWARSAFVRYDSTGLGQMYSPWFSNMPGFNDPNYWNYKNDELDSITQKIYAGEFDTREERIRLIQDATVLGIDESVRIFLASKTDQYVTNDSVSGIVNDFGAGVPSRFTPINSKGGDELAIGVKQIYQGAWNPVMGLSDSYSNHIWGIIADPAAFKHPFTGKTFPVRASWNVETYGPDGSITLPEDAITWNVAAQSWSKIPAGTTATSKVTFDFEFGNWHHGEMMDMSDILYSLYFIMEWGTQTDSADKTFDSEFTPRVAQVIDTISGIRQTGSDTIEVYVDYWHFDDGEIADWASLWSVVPWEITAAMEKTVTDGKASFSRSGATNKGVNWLSLIVPNDARLIQDSLNEFKSNGFVPIPIKDIAKYGSGNGSGNDSGNYSSTATNVTDRYDASIAWIAKYNHAVISNGPFYLESYSPDARTITVNAFADETYPFEAGRWSDFEVARHPEITNVAIPDIVQSGTEMEIDILTENATSVRYFLTGSDGTMSVSGAMDVTDGSARIVIPDSETGMLGHGASTVKIFATSEDVSRPDFYTTGFLVSEGHEMLPDAMQRDGMVKAEDDPWWFWPVIPVAVIAALLAVKPIRKRVSRPGRTVS